MAQRVAALLLLTLPHSTPAALFERKASAAALSGGGLSAQRHEATSDHSALEDAVRKHAEDNVIILSFTNWGDSATMFPDNFVHTLTQAGRSNYLLVATDNKAYEYLRCRGFNAYNDALSFKGTKLTEKVSGYENDVQSAYHVLALGRFQIVSWVLGMGFHVIFTDTDVVTIKDPVSMLLEAPHDVMFLWDGANTADGKTHLLGRGTSGAKGEIQSNAGFFFARNNERTLAWFKNVQKLMDQEAALRAKGKGQRNDQQIMAASLEKAELAAAGAQALDWKLMPRDVLVNGWLIKNQYKDAEPKTPGCMATGPGKLKHTANWMVIHMNYNKGFKRKVTHFKRCGLWACEFCNAPLDNKCMQIAQNWDAQGFNKNDF